MTHMDIIVGTGVIVIVISCFLILFLCMNREIGSGIASYDQVGYYNDINSFEVFFFVHTTAVMAQNICINLAVQRINPSVPMRAQPSKLFTPGETISPQSDFMR